MGVEINLLRLFLEREEENPYNSQHNVVYLLQYLQATPSHALPFTVFCVLFNTAKPMESQQKWT